MGGLRMSLTHTASGATINTDAPVDNHGRGEAFSPTDLVAAALGSCALTIMGIYAENHGLDITGAKLETTKTMGKEPRRISAIDVVITIPDRSFTREQKKSLERAALACPVHKTLHPDTVQNFIFNWL